MNQQGFNNSNENIQIDPSSNQSSPRSTAISRSQSSSSASFSSQSNCTKSLSLVDSIEFKFDGNISRNALTLGDCDNDEKNELIIGTLNGELLIYKDNSRNPLTSTKDLGMVACVLVGDILNRGGNSIISLSIEGYLKIFNLYTDNNPIDSLISSEQQQNYPRRHLKFSNSVQSSNSVKLPPTISDNEVYSSTAKLVLVHFQQMQSNAISAILVDFDNDGQNEFLVALSDRVVRCYRSVTFGDDVKLIGLYKWEFSDQIGSIALNSFVPDYNSDNADDSKLVTKKSLLVAQFGGKYAKITCCQNLDNDSIKSEEIEQTVEYCYTLTQEIRNPQTSAQILSDIVGPNKNENLTAFASHDGTVILLNDQTIKWRHQLEPPILSLNKHDINQDGYDELIICVWSGLVYIIDLDGNFVNCHFHEPISAFISGHYHLNDRQVNCLVYTTFTNSIRLYYNIDPFLLNTDANNNGNHLLNDIEINQPDLIISLEKLVKKLKTEIQSETEEDENSIEIGSELIRMLLYEIP